MALTDLAKGATFRQLRDWIKANQDKAETLEELQTFFKRADDYSRAIIENRIKSGAKEGSLANSTFEDWDYSTLFNKYKEANARYAEAVESGNLRDIKVALQNRGKAKMKLYETGRFGKGDTIDSLQQGLSSFGYDMMNPVDSIVSDIIDAVEAEGIQLNKDTAGSAINAGYAVGAADVLANAASAITLGTATPLKMALREVVVNAAVGGTKAVIQEAAIAEASGNFNAERALVNTAAEVLGAEALGLGGKVTGKVITKAADILQIPTIRNNVGTFVATLPLAPSAPLVPAAAFGGAARNIFTQRRNLAANRLDGRANTGRLADTLGGEFSRILPKNASGAAIEALENRLMGGITTLAENPNLTKEALEGVLGFNISKGQENQLRDLAKRNRKNLTGKNKETRAAHRILQYFSYDPETLTTGQIARDDINAIIPPIVDLQRHGAGRFFAALNKWRQGSVRDQEGIALDGALLRAQDGIRAARDRARESERFRGVVGDFYENHLGLASQADQSLSRRLGILAPRNQLDNPAVRDALDNFAYPGNMSKQDFINSVGDLAQARNHLAQRDGMKQDLEDLKSFAEDLPKMPKEQAEQMATMMGLSVDEVPGAIKNLEANLANNAAVFAKAEKIVGEVDNIGKPRNYVAPRTVEEAAYQDAVARGAPLEELQELSKAATESVQALRNEPPKTTPEARADVETRADVAAASTDVQGNKGKAQKRTTGNSGKRRSRAEADFVDAVQGTERTRRGEVIGEPPKTREEIDAAARQLDRNRGTTVIPNRVTTPEEERVWLLRNQLSELNKVMKEAKDAGTITREQWMQLEEQRTILSRELQEHPLAYSLGPEPGAEVPSQPFWSNPTPIADQPVLGLDQRVAELEAQQSDLMNRLASTPASEEARIDKLINEFLDIQSNIAGLQARDFNYQQTGGLLPAVRLKAGKRATNNRAEVNQATLGNINELIQEQGIDEFSLDQVKDVVLASPIELNKATPEELYTLVTTAIGNVNSGDMSVMAKALKEGPLSRSDTAGISADAPSTRLSTEDIAQRAAVGSQATRNTVRPSGYSGASEDSIQSFLNSAPEGIRDSLQSFLFSEANATQRQNFSNMSPANQLLALQQMRDVVVERDRRLTQSEADLVRAALLPDEDKGAWGSSPVLPTLNQVMDQYTRGTPSTSKSPVSEATQAILDRAGAPKTDTIGDIKADMKSRDNLSPRAGFPIKDLISGLARQYKGKTFIDKDLGEMTWTEFATAAVKSDQDRFNKADAATVGQLLMQVRKDFDKGTNVTGDARTLDSNTKAKAAKPKTPDLGALDLAGEINKLSEKFQGKTFQHNKLGEIDFTGFMDAAIGANPKAFEAAKTDPAKRKSLLRSIETTFNKGTNVPKDKPKAEPVSIDDGADAVMAALLRGYGKKTSSTGNKPKTRSDIAATVKKNTPVSKRDVAAETNIPTTGGADLAAAQEAAQAQAVVDALLAGKGKPLKKKKPSTGSTGTGSDQPF